VYGFVPVGVASTTGLQPSERRSEVIVDFAPVAG
jgi:hypothetical protein